VQAAPPLAAEAATSAQQTEPQPAGGGSSKKDKERLRKERQRQRKMDEAWEALQGAVEELMETAGARSVDAVEEAMQAAEKHEARSERLTALVAEARGMAEQARAAEAAEVAAAVEAAEVAAAVEAVERLRLEEQMAELALRKQTRRAEGVADALLLQQVQARLGVLPAAPAPHPNAEETMCVVCFDAPKDHAIVPCMHMCVCEACAQLLRDRCPVCRGPIERIVHVFT
jgi:hypothetical protein